jgi:hypothetical protein
LDTLGGAGGTTARFLSDTCHIRVGCFAISTCHARDFWKAYIDFEVAEGERERARELYERLIQLSGHVKVWIAYALFEGEPIPVPRDDREDEEEDEEGEVKTTPGDAIKARGIFQRAYNDLKSKKLIDEVRYSTCSLLPF